MKNCESGLCTKRNISISGGAVMLLIVLFSSQMSKILDGNCTYCKTFPGGQISNWSMSHFILCFIAGIICPDNFDIVFKLSVLWEVIEFYFEYDNRVLQTPFTCKFINRCKDKPISNKEFFDGYFGKTNHRTLYYCSNGYIGQISDIFLNSTGYMLGAYLRKNYM